MPSGQIIPYLSVRPIKHKKLRQGAIRAVFCGYIREYGEWLPEGLAVLS